MCLPIDAVRSARASCDTESLGPSVNLTRSNRTVPSSSIVRHGILSLLVALPVLAITTSSLPQGVPLEHLARRRLLVDSGNEKLTAPVATASTSSSNHSSSSTSSLASAPSGTQAALLQTIATQTASSTPSHDSNGLKVKPPLDGPIPNCPRCARPVVPDQCGYIPPPQPQAARRKLLAALHSGLELGEHRWDLGEGGWHGERRRRLLAGPARGRAGPARARRPSGKGAKGRRTRSTSSAHRHAFTPPSTAFEQQFQSKLRAIRDNPLPCGVWTRECAVNFVQHNNSAGIPWQGTKGQRDPLLINFKDKKLPADYDRLFPDLAKGALGSCAVVAVGDVLLSSARGAEIDAHDTVWRYNAPLKKYARHVGKKADVIYWKVRGDEKEYGMENQQARRFYMWKDSSKFWMFGSKKDWTTHTFRGKPVIWSSVAAAQLYLNTGYNNYKAEKKLDRGSPSGGCKLAFDVLASGLCTRVDLYGFTAKGSAKYFNKGKIMSTVHLMGLEHYMYRQAMEVGMMCVYD